MILKTTSHQHDWVNSVSTKHINISFKFWTSKVRISSWATRLNLSSVVYKESADVVQDGFTELTHFTRVLETPKQWQVQINLSDLRKQKLCSTTFLVCAKQICMNPPTPKTKCNSTTCVHSQSIMYKQACTQPSKHGK